MQPPESDPVSAEVPGRQPRQGSRGRWIKGPLGCLAFVIGALLTLVLLGPLTFGRWARGQIENAAGEQIAGRIELERSELRWFSTQSFEARLFDPDSRPVAHIEAEAAPLSRWLGSFGRDLGHNRLRFELDLEADPTGRINLDRALESQSPGRPEPESEAPKPSSPGGNGSPELDLQRFTGVFELLPSRLTFVDRRPDARLAEVRMEDIEGRFTLHAGEAPRGSLKARIVEPPGGELTAEFSFDAGPGDGPGSPRVTLSAHGLPTAVLDALFGGMQTLTLAIGELLDVDVELSIAAPALAGASRSGSLRLRASSPSLALDQSFELAGGRAFAVPSPGFSLTPSPQLLEHLFGLDGAGQPAVQSLAGQALLLRLQQLDFELKDSDQVKPPTLAEVGQEWSLVLPGLSLQGPSFEGLGLPAGTKLLSLTMHVEQAAKAPGKLSLASRLEAPGESPSRIDLEAVLPPLSVLAAHWQERRLPLSALDLDVENLPAALLDRLASGGGLARDVMGSALSLRLHADALEVPLDEPATLVADVRLNLLSAKCSASFAGQLGQGLFQSLAAGPSQVRFELDQAASRRLVGGLLPLFEAVRGKEPGQRSLLDLSDLSLPLDGDLSRLSGHLRLDLGEVQGSFFAPLAQLWPAAANFQSQRIDPIDLDIQAGRVQYEGVLLRVLGQRLPVGGSFDLVSGALAIDTELPLGLLGGDLGKALSVVKSALPAETGIPLRIGGQRGAPRIELGAGVSKLIEQAAGNALQQGLEGALQGQLPAALDGLLNGQKPPPKLSDLLEQLKPKKPGG